MAYHRLNPKKKTRARMGEELILKKNRNKLDPHKRNMTLAAGKPDCVTCETNRGQERYKAHQ